MNSSSETLRLNRATGPRRIDWEPGDPAAPAATSVVPGATVVVTNDRGDVLMIQRSDSGYWAIPGGAMELGESLPATAVRECLEETGITVELTGLVGTFTDPARRVEFRTERPEVRQEFSVVYMARPVGGAPRPSSESLQVRWVPRCELAELSMTDAMRTRLAAWMRVAGGGSLHLG